MFTPVHSLIGAHLLHLSTSHHLHQTGRPLGISGILNNAFAAPTSWRWAFCLGLIASAVLGTWIAPALGSIAWGVHGFGISDGLLGGSWTRRILAGLLVGFGSKLGYGCTSGHFLCGIPRLSLRSFVASMTFFITATITSNLFPHPGFALRTAATSSSSKTVPAGSIPTLWPKSTDLPYLIAIPLVFQTLYSVVLPRVLRQDPRDARRSETVLSLVSGLTFGTGLLMSGMVSPLKTLGFMRLPFLSSLSPHAAAQSLSDWDPSLAMVILAGVVPNMVWYLIHTLPRIQNGLGPVLHDAQDSSVKRVTPEVKTNNNNNNNNNNNSSNAKTTIPSSLWQIPVGTAAMKLNARLVVGSFIFGLGWGLGGICPGPAVVRLGLDGMTRPEGWGFLASVLSGMGLVGLVV